MIKVWYVQTAVHFQESLVGQLQIDEQDRYHRLLDKEKAKEFVVTRTTLRQALAQLSQIRPEQILFKQSGNEKPSCPALPDLPFNVSHSNGHCLIAVNDEPNEIGIDIEAHRNVNIQQLSERYFSTNEQQQLSGIDDCQVQKQAFYNIWSRKEAFVKAHGKGIALGLRHFTVNYQDTAELLDTEKPCDMFKDWNIVDLNSALQIANTSAALVSTADTDFQLESTQSLS